MKIARSLVAGLLVALSAGSQAAPIEYAGHYYDFVGGTFSWTQANAAALASTYNGLSGHLAVITSAEENAIIDSLFDNGFAWIGASDAGSEGNFTWRSGPEAGAALSYTNWAGGEPNNFGGSENYAMMVNGGYWNDVVNNYGLSYIVEFEADDVPEPAMLGLFGLGALGLGLSRRRKA